MKLLKITTIAATLFAMVVIMLGSFTRLADAGLGCPDWPGCYGHILWPNETHEIEKANQAYPDMPVDQAKTWPEMVHRYLASSLGLMMIIMVALAYRVKDTVVPKGHIWGLLGLVIVQGLFGMWTVTLKLWPQVVTTHLLGGFLTFNLLFLLSLRLTNWRLPVTHDTSRIVSLKKLALLSLVVVIIQIVLGGWTTSNYAAVACPDFPLCQGQWIPPTDFAQGFNITQHIGPNYLGGTMDNDARVAIHLSHRIGAIVVMLVLIAFCLQLFKAGMAKAAGLVATVLTIQVLLGVRNIIFHFPISVAVAHNLVGALLAAAVVFVLYSLHSAEHAHG